MGSFINAAVIAIVSFVSVGSTVGYVLEWQDDNEVRLANLETRWGFATDGTTLLHTRLTFDNDHRMAVTLVQLDHEVLVNGVEAFSSTRTDPVLVPAETEVVVPATGTLPADFANGWLELHLEDDERTSFVIRGLAEFRFSNRIERVPFEAHSETKTTIADAFSRSTASCPKDAAGLCIEEFRVHRPDGPAATRYLETVVTLNNPTGSSITLRDPRLEMQWQGIGVAAGGAADSFTLPPGGSITFHSPLRWDADALQQWWPRHLTDCERTDMRLWIALDFQQDGRHGTLSWTSPADELVTRMSCQNEDAGGPA